MAYYGDRPAMESVHYSYVNDDIIYGSYTHTILEVNLDVWFYAKTTMNCKSVVCKNIESPSVL